MIDERELGLAQTKLRPPIPPKQLVPRARLYGILDTGIDDGVRLMLATAPAGSGKSTLLLSWLTSRPEAAAWLQVEESDSDPARFWAYLLEAIGQAHPAIADDLRATITTSGGDELAVVPMLVNKLAEITKPLIIVIDDYHLIHDAAVHDGVERLIDLCPQQVTVVISTRVDPPFRLGRLRVRQQIAEIRVADLRFENNEAAGLLGPVGPTLESSLVDQLCDRTEGWAAGLVLAGLSLRRAANPSEFVDAFHGDDQLVVEYLSDELLASVEPEHRRRLLETSILERLTGGLVDAVTAGTGGSEWLRETANVNQMLIGLDSTGTWYRYHHLLRDLFRLEADRSFPEMIPELHGRAAGWFETQGDDGSAIEHRLAAGDIDAAVQIMYEYGQALLGDGQIGTLRGLLDQLGDAGKAAAWCTLMYAWCDYIDGDYDRSEEWVEVTHRIASDQGDRIVTLSLRTSIALARGNIAAALDLVDPLTTEQLTSQTSPLATVTGGAYAWAGQADKARDVLEVAVARAKRNKFLTSEVLSMVYRAIVEFESGSSADAQVAACLAVERADEAGLSSYHLIAPTYAIRARTGGDPESSRVDVARSVDLARRASTDLARGYTLAICGDTLLDLGDSTGAQLLVESRSIIDHCPDPGIVGRYLTRAESRHGVNDVAGEHVTELVEQLTEREMAVLVYLPTPMSQRDIASELYVSLNTVKTHCRAIYRKLGVGDRKSAVQAARDLQIL